MSGALELPAPNVACCMCRQPLGAQPFMTALEWRGRDVANVPFHVGCLAELIAQRVAVRLDDEDDDDDEPEDDDGGVDVVIDLGNRKRPQRR